MAQPIRIGMIGAGGICRNRHIPNLKQANDVELVSVSNRSPASSQAVQQEFGFTHWDEHWQELIKRPDIDVVWIGTWPVSHRKMTVAALQADKHVFCQARMAGTLADAEAMLATAEQRPDLVTAICPPPHRMPVEHTVQRLLPQLGRLLAVELRVVNSSNRQPSDSFRQHRRDSGLHIMQVGIWAEVLNAWFGPYQQLQAHVDQVASTTTNGIAIDVPQQVAIQGRLANGAMITEWHSSLLAGPTQSRVLIHGSQGSLCCEHGRVLLTTGEQAAFQEVPIADDERWQWDVEDRFLSAVRLARTGQPWPQPPCSFADGVAYMRKMDALWQSAASGQMVSLS